MPHQSCIQAGHRSRFPFHKVAGFDALNFDHHWPVLTDARKLSPQLNLTLITAAELHQRLYKIKNLRQHLLAITRSPRWLGQLLSKLANRNDGIVKRTLSYKAISGTRFTSEMGGKVEHKTQFQTQ